MYVCRTQLRRLRRLRRFCRFGGIGGKKSIILIFPPFLFQNHPAAGGKHHLSAAWQRSRASSSGIVMRLSVLWKLLSLPPFRLSGSFCALCMCRCPSLAAQSCLHSGRGIQHMLFQVQMAVRSTSIPSGTALHVLAVSVAIRVLD